MGAAALFHALTGVGAVAARRSAQHGGGRVWLALAISPRIDGRGHELRTAYAPGHGQDWLRLWPVNFVIKGVRRDLYDFYEQLKGYMWAKNEGVLAPDPGQGDAGGGVPEPRVPAVLADGGPCRGHRDRGGCEACRHLDSPAQPPEGQVGGHTWCQERDQRRWRHAAFGQAHPVSINEHACEPLSEPCEAC